MRLLRLRGDPGTNKLHTPYLFFFLGLNPQMIFGSQLSRFHRDGKVSQTLLPQFDNGPDWLLVTRLRTGQLSSVMFEWFSIEVCKTKTKPINY